MSEIEHLFSDCIIDKEKLINDLKIDKEYLMSVHNNSIYNNVIIDYYKKICDEDKYIKRGVIHNLENCNKYFIIDRYDFNQIKDFISTGLCHNKFCNNCKKVKQACRMSRYIPELKLYGDRMYHIVFTLPSVNSNDLRLTINKMSKAFAKLIRYINGTKKLSFLNFSNYEYIGCIRSLEITFKNDLYHPHYHCAFAFDNLNLEKNITNIYSYDFLGKRDLRLFSEFEIILQKIWYLLLNNKKINKENFDIIDTGYSVICNKFKDNDYAELFKYMTKETDETNNILTYENFKTLYYSTVKLKQIQGYGKFYKINDEDLKEEAEKIYCDIISCLNLDEDPVSCFETPYQLLYDNHYTLISRKKIFQHLKELNKK